MREQVDLGFPSVSVSANGVEPDEGWHVPFMRIGHGGAGAHAPANTLKSLALAIELGVDMVEFDVRSCRDEVVLLHYDELSAVSQAPGLASQCSLEELRTVDVGEGERIPTLGEAVDLIKGRALLNVDLKEVGIEPRVVELLEEKGVLSEALISSKDPDSLKRVRRSARSARTAISYPVDPGQASTRPYLKPIVTVALRIMRSRLPHHILDLIGTSQANGAMLYLPVVSRAAIATVHEARGRVFVWTVDDLATLGAIRSLGADGAASNRPELFQRLK